MSSQSVPKKSSTSAMVTIGSWITGIGLILLAVQCLVYPGAADGYGVAPLDDNGFAYLLATGMRDLFFGVVTIYLLLKFRAALAVYYLAMLIVPVADTMIVLRYGNSLLGLWPHVAGIFVIGALSFLCFREQRQL